MTVSSLVSTRYFCAGVELIVALGVVVISLIRPTIASEKFRAVENFLRRQSRAPARAICLVAFAALLGRAVILPLIPKPSPSVHDEFSYLLAGKTFAEGRLTNPPHLFWKHFESIHILQQPTYMSMYPPAQGMFLAAGKWLSGSPWVGVWLATILMAAAICWMLQGWISPAWAFAGALLFVVRWCWFSYWVNSYWGGSVPAFAAALVLGSLPRLVRRASFTPAMIFATGFILLANARPYEGFVFTVAIGCLLGLNPRHWGYLRRIFKPRTLIPFGLLLTMATAFLFYYNSRVSGHAFLFPYMANRQQYATAPLFLFESARPEPHYRSARIRQVYDDERSLYQRERENLTIPETFRKLKDFWLFYLGPLLTVPVIALFVRRPIYFPKQIRLAGLIVMIVLAAILPEVWFYPHYAAPIMPAMILLIVAGLKQVRDWELRGRPTGLFLSRAIPLACFAICLIPVLAAAAGARLDYWPLSWYGGNPDVVQPPWLTEHFQKSGEKALIFVRYGNLDPVGDEWVYNDPDIDRSLIVWAREINPSSDAELVRYFRNRSIWLLDVDSRPWKLVPYRTN